MFLSENPLEEAKHASREAFLLFEHKEGSKMVDERDIPIIFQYMGINPSTTQIQSLMEKLQEGNEEAAQFITLEKFEKVFPFMLIAESEQFMRDDFHRLMAAFSAHDPDGNGFIDMQTMKTLMQTQGEPMSDEAVNLMMSACCDDDGRIYYEDYAYLLANDGRKA